MKTEVMRAKKQLTGTAIYLDDDLTYKERIIQGNIRRRKKEEKAKGNKVFMGHR